jgi:Na+-driven multidrug efflux pump
MPQRWGPGALIEILRVGVPASLSTLINYLGLMVLTGVVARLGDSHLAAYGLGTRVDFLLMSLAYGFGVAVLTLVGLSTGARQRHRTKVYVLRAGSINASFLAIFSIVLFEWPEVWLRLFTQDAEVLAVGANYFRWIAPSYPFMGIAMVISFAFQGLGRATIPLLWMVVRVVGVVLTSLVAVAWFGATDTAVFAIVAGGNILSAGIMTLLFLWLGPRTAQ